MASHLRCREDNPQSPAVVLGPDHNIQHNHEAVGLM